MDIYLGMERSLSMASIAGYIESLRGGSLLKRLVAAFIMASLTGAAAQIRIPLPFTPVPLTGQVFAVLMSGVFLGGGFGALSQIIYLAAGGLGIPWFSGASFGPAVILGPTGGYIAGFTAAAYISGRFVRSSQGMLRSTFLMMAAVLVIYICGAAQFSVVMKAGVKETLFMAVAPFIGLDLAKAVLVSVLFRRFAK